MSWRGVSWTAALSWIESCRCVRAFSGIGSTALSDWPMKIRQSCVCGRPPRSGRPLLLRAFVRRVVVFFLAGCPALLCVVWCVKAARGKRREGGRASDWATRADARRCLLRFASTVSDERGFGSDCCSSVCKVVSFARSVHRQCQCQCGCKPSCVFAW